MLSPTVQLTTACLALLLLGLVYVMPGGMQLAASDATRVVQQSYALEP